MHIHQKRNHGKFAGSHLIPFRIQQNLFYRFASVIQDHNIQKTRISSISYLCRSSPWFLLITKSFPRHCDVKGLLRLSVTRWLTAPRARSAWGLLRWLGPRCAEVSSATSPTDPLLWKSTSSPVGTLFCAPVTTADPAGNGCRAWGRRALTTWLKAVPWNANSRPAFRKTHLRTHIAVFSVFYLISSIFT